MGKIKVILLLIPLLFFLVKAPDLSAREYTHLHIVDLANPTPLEKIKKHYSAYDINEGYITDRITFKTDYDEKNCQVGSYDLEVSITNSAFYTTTIIDTILVRDFKAPTITVKKEYLEIDISKELDLSQIYEALEIVDNLDITFELIIEGLEDIYTACGEYTLFVYVIDSSTNTSNKVELKVSTFETIKKTILTTTIPLNRLDITKEEIIALFLDNASIPQGYTRAELSTPFLNPPISNGIYPAEIRFYYADGTSILYTFKLEYRQEAESSNTYIKPLIITGATIGLLLIGFIIYRKRR